MIGRSMAYKELGQTLQDIIRVQPAGHDDHQTDRSELVDHGEHAELAAVMGPVLDEIVGPDMVRPARSQPDTGAVIEPEAAPLGLLPGGLSAPPAARSAGPA